MRKLPFSFGVKLTMLSTIFRRINRNIRKLVSLSWKPYSRLILSGDKIGWSLDWDMRELNQIACRLGIRTVNSDWQDVSANQANFLANQFFLINDDWLALPHRIGFSYFHGLPNTGEPLFDQVYTALGKHHDRISRIQVTHNQMREAVLQTGIEPAKVFLIPIGVNLDFFSLSNAETKIAVRQKLNIPQSAFVIGSFQKDGNGWEEGLEPKLIKGPDVFLDSIRELKAQIPELYVLLSGPARGYVKVGLGAMQVPYSHLYLDSYPQIGELFQALDLYLVTSRQEGGPKAILESMASGVPIISTRVGQATDLIQHGQNGWLAEVGNSEEIADLALRVRDLSESTLAPILLRGRATAENNSYQAQIPLWANFMRGFVVWNS
jgi:glycosyltransferase involved in cell wall biosynthesis